MDESARNVFPARIRLALAGVFVVVVAGCVHRSRELADAEIDVKCRMECGIRVFQTVTVERSQSRVIGKPTWTTGNMERPVGSDFVLKRSHVFSQPHGVSVYKYTTWLERRSDGKRLSEMTWYFREGDEVFHGKHFPQPPLGIEQLVEQTLMLPPPNSSMQPTGKSVPAADAER